MNVNLQKRGRPGGGKSKLSKGSIVQAAREWLLQENRRLSVRALARQLDVDVMAIYHYFDNKATLLEAATISIMQDIYLPEAKDDWQTELAILCRSYLHLLKKNPGLLETLLSMGAVVQGPASIFEERFALAVAPLKLEEALRKTALDLLVDYLHGFALAMHHTAGDQKPEIDDIQRPLGLYFRSLALLAARNDR